MSRGRLPRTLAALTVVGACRPDLGPPVSSITEARVLAIRAEPPEASPGEAVSYRALVASPSGTLDDAAIAWGFCASPKPLTENDAVAAACLRTVRAIGDPSVATTPIDACRLFGPDPPPGGLRPRDPDGTGGYFQPVRAALGASLAFRLERITCDLPTAPLDVSAAYAVRYRRNRNPTQTPVTVTLGEQPIAPTAIPAGATLTLGSGWLAGDAEDYVLYDADTRTLVDRREVLTAAWFVTAGTIGDEVTGDAGGEIPRTSTSWTAPAEPGRVWLWTVLRDDRGGVDYATTPFDVVAR